MTPRFFRSAAAFHVWLARHHASARELLVGFHHVGSSKGGLTYPDARDEALCFGWIDGMRKHYNATSYTIRFTPRRRDSVWSTVNLDRIRELKAQGRMQPAGLAIFEARDLKKARLYAFENRPRALDAAALRGFRSNARAWAWFSAQAPWYRRSAAWWAMNPKRAETRARRLAMLISASARGEKASPFNVARESRRA
jgi:uncharacterized protein YdeI (YjbR/CyaY-like superfamily)